MRSIKRRFKIFANKNPNSSTFVNFRLAIQGQNFQKRTMRHWFKRLVDANDYNKKEKCKILRDLENQNPP